MFYTHKTLRYKVDFQKLYMYLGTFFSVREIKYYTGYNPRLGRQLKFLAKLESLGYKIIRKPVKRISVGKKTIEKANVDVELAVDAIREKALYENMILLSGDSDFSYLVKVLQEEGKKVVVFSSRGHISKELADLSDYLVNFERLENELAL